MFKHVGVTSGHAPLVTYHQVFYYQRRVGNTCCDITCEDLSRGAVCPGVSGHRERTSSSSTSGPSVTITIPSSRYHSGLFKRRAALHLLICQQQARCRPPCTYCRCTSGDRQTPGVLTERLTQCSCYWSSRHIRRGYLSVMDNRWSKLKCAGPAVLAIPGYAGVKGNQTELLRRETRPRFYLGITSYMFYVQPWHFLCGNGRLPLAHAFNFTHRVWRLPWFVRFRWFSDWRKQQLHFDQVSVR